MAELTNLVVEVVEITWYCRYRLERVMLFVVAETVVQAGHATPLVDAPVDTLSGDPAPDGPLQCLLFGSTTPLPAARIAERYDDPAAYLQAFEESADASIAAGFVLPEDREALLAYAQPDRVR